MTETTPERNHCPEARHSTNAYAEIAGVKHQITARGESATECADNYFATLDALKDGYAARAKRLVIDPARLLALVACGMEKAKKCGDFERAIRLVKAAQLVQDGAVERCEDSTYTVASQTQTNMGYYVNAEYACSCEDWQRHAESTETYWCKHGISAMMIEKLMSK